jgi:predicted small lipoprotein YifL
MKFNKKVLALLVVLICSIALAGCGGGGGSSSTPSTTPNTNPSTNPSTSNPASIYVAMQDTSGKALVGVVMHYTDPNAVAKTTAPSDAQGKIVVAINPAGSYAIGTFDYNGVTYSSMKITSNYNTSNDYYKTYQLNTTTGSGINLTDSHSVAK